MKNFKRILSSYVALFAVAGMTLATPALAAQYGTSFMGSLQNGGFKGPAQNENVMNSGHFNGTSTNMKMYQMRTITPVVFGTVSNVSGDTITVTVPARY